MNHLPSSQEPPPGQFFNPFGESVTPKDIQYAFEFVDYRNNHRISLVDLQVACEKMDVDKPERIFAYLDVGDQHNVDFNDWKQALSERQWTEYVWYDESPLNINYFGLVFIHMRVDVVV